MHIKNPLILDKIQAAMNLLNDLIEESKNYQDKSLFFQDPRVIEGWLLLAGEIKEIEIEDAPEHDEKWELRTEPFAASLLARRDLFSNYKKLYHLYYDPLFSLWMNCGLDGECISADAQEVLKADHYEKILNVEDIDQYFEEVNSRSNDARYFVYKTISYIFEILQAIMNKAGQVVIDLKPSDEDFAKAINDDLREWTLHYGNEMLEVMIEEMNRNYKEYRTDDDKPELWGEMLRADEEALKMAMKQQLSQCNDDKQEHWGEDMKAQMDENGELMRMIYSSVRTKKLLDLGNTDNLRPFIEWLTPDNITLFYELIVRRSLIQCEMFPELKKQHEKWLNPTEDQHCPSETANNGVKPLKLDTETPEAKLIQLLSRDWFKECTTNADVYNSSWRSKYVKALMKKFGTQIATGWKGRGKRTRQNLIKGHMLGALKNAGVIDGNNSDIARMALNVGVQPTDKEVKKIASYIGHPQGENESQENPYRDWTAEYVKNNQ